MIAAMKENANKNSKTKLLHREKRERKRFHYTGCSYRMLQFYKFLIISRIEDGWRKLKILLFENINKNPFKLSSVF